MATAEDRRVRLQSYADAKTLDRARRGGAQGGRIARLLDRVLTRVRLAVSDDAR